MATSISQGEPRISSTYKTGGTPDQLQITMTATINHQAVAVARVGSFELWQGDWRSFAWWNATTFYPKALGYLDKLYTEDTDISIVANLKVYCSVIYNFESPSEIARDLLRFYGYADLDDKYLILPTSDGSPQQWTRSAGTSNYYTYIDAYTEDPDTIFYLYTSTGGNRFRVRFYNADPTDLSYVHAVHVRMWGKINSVLPGDTYTGQNFLIRLYDGTGQVEVDRHIDMQVDNTIRYSEVHFDDLDWSATNFDDLEIEVEAGYGSIGATPNCTWYIYNLEVRVIWKSSTKDYIDYTSFSSIDSHFTAPTENYLLQMPIYDTTVKDALMELLSYAPEMYVYIDNDGKLAGGLLDAFSSHGSPKVYGLHEGNLLRIKRVWTYEDKWCDRLEVDFDSECPNRALSSATEEPEPNKNFRNNMDTFGRSVHEFQDSKLRVERPWLRHNTDDDITRQKVNFFIDNYKNIYGEKIQAVEFEANAECLENKPGDVIAVDDPVLGYDERKFRVVGIDFDIDKLEGTITAYALQYTL